MRIGLLQHGWWTAACEALGKPVVALPAARHANGNAYAADLAARTANAAEILRIAERQPLDLLLDNGGTGLGFAAAGEGDGSFDLLHERLKVPLCSHFVDPITTALQGLEWPVVWQSLQSAGWIKFVWDRAQAAELQRFGVPQVVHLPMAAPDRAYDTEPLDASRFDTAVSFVGGQNTTFFASGVQVPSARLLPGVLLHAIQCDLRNVSSYEAYHDLYGIGHPIEAGDDIETRIRKSAAYFNLKEFYNAGLCIRQRDRFVLFLKRKLGEGFRLIGNRWDEAYGLACEPQFPATDEYFDHFRRTAINLNFVNGNSETGLNMRHFEITAAGGFMLCYDQPELVDYFAVGKECAVFQSEADLLEKIRYYLDRPHERQVIALAGQERTLSQHLYSHRLRALLQVSQPLVRAHPVEYSSSSWDRDLKAAVPEAGVIFDCGANTGQMAAAFRRLYPAAEIYCFEPVKAVFNQLVEHCRELRATPVCKAVGDEDGSAAIHLTASPEANSLMGFQPGNPCAKWTQIVGTEQVDVCTLDRWCRQAGVDPKRVDVIKLDIQGAELKALYGAKHLLKTVKAVFVEVSFVSIYRDAPLFETIDAFLRESGYRRCAVYPSDQPQNWGDALYVKT